MLFDHIWKTREKDKSLKCKLSLKAQLPHRIDRLCSGHHAKISFLFTTFSIAYSIRWVSIHDNSQEAVFRPLHEIAKKKKITKPCDSLVVMINCNIIQSNIWVAASLYRCLAKACSWRSENHQWLLCLMLSTPFILHCSQKNRKMAMCVKYKRLASRLLLSLQIVFAKSY